MKTHSVSFFEYLQKELAPYRWISAAVIAVLVSAGFWLLSLYDVSKSNRDILSATSPYVAGLVESQDRPEILRIIQSISVRRGSHLIVVSNLSVVASTRSISEMDSDVLPPKERFSIFGSTLTDEGIESSETLLRTNGTPLGAKLLMITPLLPVLLKSAFVSMIALFVSLVLAFISSYKTRSAVRSAIAPLEQLHHEIKSLSNETDSVASPIAIKELEDFRLVIANTKRELANTKDSLAVERAKQLTSDSYKRLIHDLHNPVTALRQMVHLFTSNTVDQETRQDALNDIPQLADQILRQVTSAKHNLSNEPTSIRQADLRASVEESFKQVLGAKGSTNQKQLTLSLPEAPVLAAYDPDLLKRAIVNLLENGIESASSRVHLSLKAAPTTASILISDDGAGFDPSQLSVYLQGRGQSKHSNRPAYGLASSNHIVRTLGGKLIYRPSEMGGAGFEIRLEAL